MPLLDLSQLTFDPYFADENAITLYSSTKTMGDDGRAILSTVTSQITGTVYPSTSDSLARLPQGENHSGAITIITIYPLQCGNTAKAADEVQYNNRMYIVKDINDWTPFGAGFVEAICVLKSLTPP